MNSLLIFQGLFMTVKLWIGASIISVCLGTVLGIFQCDRLRLQWCGSIISFYVYAVRSIPVYVQVLIAYFVLPELLGINLTAYLAAIIALGLCSTGYIAEIIRGGINAVSNGQWEASQVLGFSRLQAVRYIILPQAIKDVLPSLSNEFESVMKSTSILSSIGVLELTKVANNIVARQMNPVSVYLVVAVCYLFLSVLLGLLFRVIKRRIEYRYF